MVEKEPSQIVWGLVEGVEVLRHLAVRPGPVTGVSVARELGLSPVRVSRLLTTLRWMGIARRDKSRRYTLGPGIHVLATQNLAASGLLQRVIRGLSPLLEHPYTVACGVLWRDQVTFLYFRSPGAQAIEGVRPWIGPATISSIGLALLSHCSDDQIQSLYGGRSDIPGLYSTTDALMEAIAQIRETGHAILRWDTHTSAAVPVGNPPYTAIACSGFQTLDEERQFLALLRDAAETIESEDREEVETSDWDAEGFPFETPSDDPLGVMPTEVYV